MDDKPVHLSIPRWMVVLYGAMAIVLVPWIIILAEYLPSKHLSHHWDALWVGFDILELIAIVLTFFFMLRRRIWVVISATALGTLLIGDAWVDILTAKPGAQFRQAIALGVIELSLASMTFRLVYQIIHHSAPDKHIHLRVHKTSRRKV